MYHLTTKSLERHLSGQQFSPNGKIRQAAGKSIVLVITLRSHKSPRFMWTRCCFGRFLFLLEIILWLSSPHPSYGCRLTCGLILYLTVTLSTAKYREREKLYSTNNWPWLRLSYDLCPAIEFRSGGVDDTFKRDVCETKRKKLKGVLPDVKRFERTLQTSTRLLLQS